MDEHQRFLLVSNKVKISEDLLVRTFSVDPNSLNFFFTCKFQQELQLRETVPFIKLNQLLYITLLVLGNK